MRQLAAILALFICGPVLAAEPDILVADFEGPDYGDWKATGEAFGPGPAHGTLPNQMDVSGFEGKGLVNSYYQGDRTTGTLTSPPIKIERKYLNFLLGGGMHPGKTCINLLVDGQAVRTATGPNDKPGGTERLDWHSWDVSDLAGKTAVIQIVDEETGGWGHINIDHIVQSDRRSGVVETVRELAIDHDYLNFCFAPDRAAARRSACRSTASRSARPSGRGGRKPSRLSWDVSQLKGQRVQLRIAELPAADGTCPLGESVALADQPQGVLIVVDKLYQETYRPQFHFTPAKNWTNDPNGLVYYAGEYHLFFQHNPTGINWGNMTWGHAVSPDLVHWQQLDHAIHPDNLGTIFSGSAVVDHQNTAGFQTGSEKPIVCIYTSAGNPFTQSIAYSNDRGRTWTKYDQNPVLKHIAGSNRDPKVIWHEPTKKWIMALYPGPERLRAVRFAEPQGMDPAVRRAHAGIGRVPGLLPHRGRRRSAAGQVAVLGRQRQLPAGHVRRHEIPAGDGTDQVAVGRQRLRRADVQRHPRRGRAANPDRLDGGRQVSGHAVQPADELPARTDAAHHAEGPRLHMLPVREIESLRGKKHAWTDLKLSPGENPLSALEGELWDVEAEIAVEKEGPAAVAFDRARRADPLRRQGRHAPLPGPLRPAGAAGRTDQAPRAGRSHVDRNLRQRRARHDVLLLPARSGGPIARA